MKQFNFISQIVAIFIALVVVSYATSVSARPDTGLQLGIPDDPITATPLVKPLDVGSTGEQVSQLQSLLRDLGIFPASVAPTGFFGEVTSASVKTFQLRKGLPETGIVDEMVWASLYQSVYPPNISCKADFNGDGALDTRDMIAYLNAWAAKVQSADMNGDGVVDNADFTAFFDSWNQGCSEEDLAIDPCSVADFNDDGKTNTMDITAYLNKWTAQDSSADMNGDGVVEQADFTTFLEQWKLCTL